MVEKKHQVQIEVIKEMKKQLEALENHIYNNKDEFDLPESFVDVFRERQNNIISKYYLFNLHQIYLIFPYRFNDNPMVLFLDQVEKKLNLSIKNSKSMSVEELKEEVDNAIQKVRNQSTTHKLFY